MIVGLIGQWDHDNFGDELIALLMMSLLKDAASNVVLYRSSPIFLQRIEDAIGRRPVAIQSEDEFADHCDSFIFCPGGYMGCSDLTDFGWKANWRGHRWSQLAALIRTLKKRYLVLGPEIGPRLPRRMAAEVRDILTGASQVFVRNVGSQKYADKNLGCSPQVVSDFILSTPAFFSENENLPEIPVAVHVTGKFFASNALADYNRRALNRWIRQAHLQSVCLIADQPIKQKFRRGIAEFQSLGEAAHCSISLMDFSSIRGLVSTLSRTNFIVTTKLHVGVTCLAYGGAVVNFASHPKVARFARDFPSPRFSYANYFLTPASRKLAILNNALDTQTGASTCISAAEVRNRYWSAVKGVL